MKWYILMIPQKTKIFGIPMTHVEFLFEKLFHVKTFILKRTPIFLYGLFKLFVKDGIEYKSQQIIKCFP